MSEKLDPKKLSITQHALQRFVERIGGFYSEMTDMLSRATPFENTTGQKIYECGDALFVFDRDTVVTVLNRSIWIDREENNL